MLSVMLNRFVRAARQEGRAVVFGIEGEVVIATLLVVLRLWRLPFLIVCALL